MNKKDLRRCHLMRIDQFLENYYSVTNEKLLRKLSKLTHRQLKQVCLSYGIELTCANFEVVDFEAISTGSVILVKDCLNNPAPYHNPLRLVYEEDSMVKTYKLKRGGNRYDKHKRR